MTADHWACQNCSAEGPGDGPCICPNCAGDDVCTFLPDSEDQQ